MVLLLNSLSIPKFNFFSFFNFLPYNISMIRVGVIRGGTGHHYEQSLASGAFVLGNLPRDMYAPIDIFIDREGIWHMEGRPLDPAKLKHRVDVVWNALHGFYGEDGKLLQQLENLGVPYTGSGPLSSAIVMNKKLLNERLAELGVQVPRGIYIESWGEGDRAEAVSEVVRTVATKFSPPWNIEPISRGHLGKPITAQTRDELAAVLFEMFDVGMPVHIGEVVRGREVSVVSLAGFRGNPTYTFLPQEEGSTRSSANRDLETLARKIHKGLGLGSYSRIETVITPKGIIHLLRIETVPALHGDSDLHHALASTGATFAEFARHMIVGVPGIEPGSHEPES